MLNRVLDRSIGPSAQAIALVDQAIGALPSQLSALRGEGSVDASVGPIMETADRLAEGELVNVRQPRCEASRTLRCAVHSHRPNQQGSRIACGC